MDNRGPESLSWQFPGGFPGQFSGHFRAGFRGDFRGGFSRLRRGRRGQTYKLALRTKTHEFRLESKEAVDEDGTVDLSHAALGLYTRGEARREETDASLWTYFLDIARELTSSFNDEGHHWPDMRAARPLWFKNAGER